MVGSEPGCRAGCGRLLILMDEREREKEMGAEREREGGNGLVGDGRFGEGAN